MRTFGANLLRLILATLAYAARGQNAPPPQITEQPAVFHVHPEQTFQTVTGFGAGAFEAAVAPQLQQADRDRMYDLLYTDLGVNLNIIRLIVPETAEPLSPADPLRQKGFLYNWPADKATQDILRALPPIFARVKPLLYLAPFSPPLRWKSDGRLRRGGALVRQHYRAYAEYLTDFVKYLERVKVLHVDVLSLQNEHDVAAPWSSARWTGEQLREFLEILGPMMKQDAPTTKLMVPEGSSWDQTAIKLEPLLADPDARRFIGVVASHSYGWDDIVDRGRELVGAAARKHALPLWMSEMSIIGPPDDPSMSTALRIARYMYRDLVEAGVSAWIYCFSIFNPEFSGSMGVLSPVRDGRLRVPKRFWAFANYSRFVRPGWKRIGVEGLSFANAAFVNPQRDRFALIALNASLQPRPATYNFGAWRISSVEASETSANSDLRAVAEPRPASGGFEATLAPVSVTTFTGKLEPSGTGRN